MSEELRCVVSSQGLSEINGTGWLLSITNTLHSETLFGGASLMCENLGAKENMFDFKVSGSLTAAHWFSPG